MKKSYRIRLKITVLAAAVFLVLAMTMYREGPTVQEAAAPKARLTQEKLQPAGNTEKPPVAALTFDDGPSGEYTEKLLDGLKKRNVKASFFLLGKCLGGNEKLVQRMQKEGHLIGNHTYNHVQLNKVSDARAREEILRTNNRIYEITGEYPVYMRPPYGAWNKEMELCVEMLPVMWSIDTLDWKTRNTQSILQIVQKNVKNGSIILMHDEYETTVQAALEVVDTLKKQGYEFVTVDRLILP